MSIMYCHKHDTHFDSDLESDCVECENECEFCAGTGVVNEDVSDGEGHTMRGVGDEKPCICQVTK